MIPQWVVTIIERWRARRLANHLIEIAGSHETILDCGSGTMSIASLLQKGSGARIIGTDILDLNETDMEMCICPGEFLPFADSSVDAVLLIFVLHHSQDNMKILQECIRVARTRVIIFEDVYRNPFELGIVKFFDRLGNRIISTAIPLPFTFKSEEEWGRVFSSFNVKLLSTHVIRPLPFLLTRHRGFALEV
ncbi:MAG: hypothetical protein KPEEDBHJ_02492 [Anaerolineales bacterium]|nr:hypothetical protein [Anaerolineales bacterium]